MLTGLLLVAAVLCFFSAPARAQQKTITGKVTAADSKEALPGVTVLVKGTTVGTSTDINGVYSLALPTGKNTILVSFIGYEPQEVTVNNQSVINFELKADAKALEEVVVIGYQTIRKQDLTGAAAVVSPKEAQRVTANSVTESIQGLAPGVTVRNTGRPGANPAVDIRGVASFTNANPLYVIDGMIADANTTINNDDVESIQILKDASAAAIYGSRAGNGVIIITTKRGKEGPAKIGVSVRQGAQQLPRLWDVMNAEEFAATQRTQYQNSGATPPSSVALAPNGTVFHYTVTDTDWQKEMTQLGTLSDYNVSLSGGAKNSNYLISGSYFSNDGAVVGNSFDRLSFRVNTQGTKGRVTFGENIALTHAWSEAPLLVNPFYDMPQLLPVIPVRHESLITPDQPKGWGTGERTIAPFWGWNYLAMTDLFNVTRKNDRIVGNAFMDVKITDWLSYKFNTGLDGGFDFQQNVRTLGDWVLGQADEPSHIFQSRQSYSTLLFENTLNFNKTFGQHNLNGVVGYTQQHSKRDFIEARRNNLVFANGEPFTTIRSASGEQSSEGGVVYEYKMYGTLGRFNYTYADKYLVTFTGRYDQDSRFAPEHRSKFFPSVALGWRMGQEKFLDAASWLSDLKLRASYGQLGINTVGAWDYIGAINNNPRVVFGQDNNVIAVGAYQASLVNPDLRWEIRTMKNVGFDAELLDNRVSITAEYYHSLSEDVLLRLPIPFYTGNLGGDPFVNAASISNRGVEFSATYRNHDTPLKWDITGNFTTIKNRIEDVGNLGAGINYLQVGATRSQVGRGIGEWYVLQTDGLFQSEEEVINHKNSKGVIIQPGSKPGDIRFKDLNDDGQISDKDRTFSGSPWPTLQTGGQFNAAYAGFNLNVQLIGVFGQTVFNDVRRILDSYDNTNFRRAVSPWTPENRNTSDPRLARPSEIGVIRNNQYASDRWLENASYVRLRNVELGYNLPKSLVSRAHAHNARVFLSAQNLLTFSNYSGLDPDVTGAGILQRGLDAGNWPASRAYTLGLNFEF